MDYTERKSGSSIASLLQGAAIGAVLGVLFAPKPGSQLREDFNEWIGEKRRRAQDLAGQASEKARDVREGFEEGYQDIERHDKEPMGI